MYLEVLGTATPAIAELTFENSAILLRSKVSLRKITSNIEVRTAAIASCVPQNQSALGEE